MLKCASEPRLELHPEDPRLVEEAGEIVEVDAADRDFLIGDVAAEQRGLVAAVVPGVTQAQAALEQRLAGELGGLVEEEVHFAAIGPVGVGEQFAAADGNAV